MPKLDHAGPEGRGPKTGRKLGKCHKTDIEIQQMGELGVGEGKRRHSMNDCGHGKGNRMRYSVKQSKNQK